MSVTASTKTIAARKRSFRVAVRKFGPFEEAIRRQWEIFESEVQSGLKLDLVSLELDALEHALFADSGMANGDWDIAFVATDWIAAMHELGCAVDLKPLLKREPPPQYPRGWSDSLLRLQRIGDKVLGVPFHDGPECLIYRRDLFDDPVLRRRYYRQFHQPLAPPATWSEFHRVAAFLHEPEKKLHGTVFAAFPDGHNAVYDFLLQLWTRGGEIADAEGRIRFATREAEEALTFYRTMLADEGAVHPDCRALDSVAAGMKFAAGEVAMMVNWFGFATYAHTAEDSLVRGLVDVANLPVGNGGAPASLNVYWMMTLAGGSPHQDVAWRFLWHSQTAEMDKLATECGAIGCRKSTWADAGIRARVPFFPRLAALHTHAREIPQRKDWPRIAAVIDSMITAAITTDKPVVALLAAADQAVAAMG